MSATINYIGLLSMQVCVPTNWADEQVLKFAEKENPCGATNGWSIRKEGHKALAGDPERVSCDEKDGHVHIMLEA